MSTDVREFYGLRCDFPDCGELFEGSEFSYWYDPGEAASESREYGWLTGFEDKDYCPSHTVSIEEYESDPDDDEWYLLRPLEDTWQNRLKVALDRVVERAHRRLEAVQRDVDAKLGGKGRSNWGNFTDRHDRATEAIWESTVRAHKPDITAQEMFDLRTGRRRTR